VWEISSSRDNKLAKGPQLEEFLECPDLPVEEAVAFLRNINVDKASVSRQLIADEGKVVYAVLVTAVAFALKIEEGDAQQDRATEAAKWFKKFAS